MGGVKSGIKSTVKGMCLRFVLITGVRGIALCDIFGGANQFHDITLDCRYATSCGYTLEEIERYFDPQNQACSRSP